MSEASPTAAVSAWLESFGAALERGDVAAAAEHFEADGFWRDLVSFTWNIRTLEGRDEIAAMLEATLDGVRPSGWASRATRPSPAPASPRRGSRSRPPWRAAAATCGCSDGRCWTLLTTMAELKGHEERTGPRRAKGVEHGAIREPRRRGSSGAQAEAAELGYERQPYCVIVGGGQGGIVLGARLRRLGVPTIIVEQQRAAGRLLAQALQVALPARPGLVRPPAVPAVPGRLAGVLAEGQDRRLARDVRQGHGAQLLGLHRVHERARTTTTRASGSSRWSARGSR